MYKISDFRRGQICYVSPIYPTTHSDTIECKVTFMGRKDMYMYVSPVRESKSDVSLTFELNSRPGEIGITSRCVIQPWWILFKTLEDLHQYHEKEKLKKELLQYFGILNNHSISTVNKLTLDQLRDIVTILKLTKEE